MIRRSEGNMRQSILISAAVGSLLAGVGAAHAAGLVPPEMMFGQPYVEFGGGLNFTSVSLTNLSATGGNVPNPSISSSTPLGSGGAFYATIGAQLMPGLRAELQGSLRSNSGARFNVSAEGNGSVGVSARTFMVMANFWKDFDLADGFSIHVGGGLGYGNKTLSVTGATPTTQSVSGLAYLAGIGADLDVAANIKLTFNYTLSDVTGSFGSSHIATTDGSGETVTGNLGKGIDQAVTVGLRFALAP
jgi:opacity protein-like surface antigen